MEYLDIIDDNDNVVGKASKDEVYEKFLPHRIVHVLIFNEKGEMALQLRSKSTKFFPNFWSTAVGGHVQSGETYEQGALREFQEELGIQKPINELGKTMFNYKNTIISTNDSSIFKIGAQGLRKSITVFETKYNGPFNIDKIAVEDVQFFSMSKIQDMVKNSEKFHPELLFFLKKYYKINKNEVNDNV